MTESIFSCYACGFEEPFAFDNSSSTSPGMMRASISKRTHQETSSSNLFRSRSQENLANRTGGFAAKDEAVELHDLSKQRTLESDEDDGILDQTAAEGEEVHLAYDAEQTATKAHAASGNRIYRRAMSDPFDTPLSDSQMAEIREAEKDAILEEIGLQQQLHHKRPSLPTFPRFPVAATRDKNCWSVPPIQIYSVRGSNYLNDKKKIPSSPYLLQSRGCDLFLFEDNLDISERSSQILGGQLRSLPTLAVNFQFPWGAMILYFEIPGILAKFVGNAKKKDVANDKTLKTPAERLLAHWLQNDSDFKNERLKLIPYVAEGPWVVRNMVTGRPAIIGKKLPVSYQAQAGDNHQHQPLLMCTLDIGSSSATAKHIVSVCRRYMSALTVDIGFVVQGNSKDELPEQMLGAIRVHGPDPLKACYL